MNEYEKSEAILEIIDKAIAKARAIGRKEERAILRSWISNITLNALKEPAFVREPILLALSMVDQMLDQRDEQDK